MTTLEDASVVLLVVLMSCSGCAAIALSGGQQIKFGSEPLSRRRE